MRLICDKVVVRMLSGRLRTAVVLAGARNVTRNADANKRAKAHDKDSNCGKTLAFP